MELLLFLESVRTPFLDSFFGFITHLGDEAAAVLILVVVLWCGNKRTAYNMLYATIFNLGTNQLLKSIFKVKRPWVQNNELTIVSDAKEAASGYSFPSGHTANATVIYGSFCARLKSGWIKAALVLLIFAIGFSRMYLGVHFPTDVIVSWFVGAAFVVGIGAAQMKAEQSKKADIMLNAALMLYALILVVYTELTKQPDDIFSMDGVKNAYTVLGLSAGLVITRYFDKYKLNKSTYARWYVQVVKCVCGLLLIAATALLVKEHAKIITNGHYLHYAIRYFAIVVAGGIIWPLTFDFWNKLGNKKEEL